MRISVPKGFKGCQYLKSVAYPKFKGQEEVLFKRGLEYMIKDAKYQEDKFILDVEVIPYER